MESIIPKSVIDHCQKHPGCQVTKSCTICSDKPSDAGAEWMKRKIKEVMVLNKNNVNNS